MYPRLPCNAKHVPDFSGRHMSNTELARRWSVCRGKTQAPLSPCPLPTETPLCRFLNSPTTPGPGPSLPGPWSHPSFQQGKARVNREEQVPERRRLRKLMQAVCARDGQTHVQTHSAPLRHNKHLDLEPEAQIHTLSHMCSHMQAGTHRPTDSSLCDRDSWQGCFRASQCPPPSTVP